ncbi:MAG TPA: anhydro-N-acetylmuramic acid kinase [Candidatus Acidoferrum sp.]|nr:anhydro-N-acetylmuramic acid kinase [Candidatus Acidoferrum sp.]
MLVMGLMSGTSADGIDVALAEIRGEPPKLRTRLLRHTSRTMPAGLRAEVLRIAEGGSCTAGEISQLNFRLGMAFADAARAGCKEFRVARSRVRLIGSHGQTIFHQGRPVSFLGRATASTLQIGEPAVIAARMGIPTVGDFRVADMAVGGQGAPLVPYADYLLYGDEKTGRVALNLGGIGNVTVLPAGAEAKEVVAFDTGPGNMLMDALVWHFTKKQQQFDRGARLARQGELNVKLLKALLRDPYLRLGPPKSTGREYYGRAYFEELLRLAKKHGAGPLDVIRTATEFTVASVVDALKRFVLRKTKVQQLIVSGGGARNPLIMAQLAASLAPMEVLRSSEVGVPEEAKEAYAFALLGYETWHRRAGNLPSATGARKPVVLGKICWG